MKTYRSTHSSAEDRAAVQNERAAAKASNEAHAAYDAMLVERFKSGNESAFTEIIQRYYPRIRTLANHTLHNHADAEEVAQDTFIRAQRALHNFRGESSLVTWLCCIGLNLARNRYWFYFRRRRHATLSLDRVMVEGSDVTLAGALTDGRVAPRADSITNEFITLIADCMGRLDPSQREILTMRSVLDLSYEEIANNLGINVGTVKSRIARARENLRELLVKVAPEFGEESNGTDFFERNSSMSTFSPLQA